MELFPDYIDSSLNLLPRNGTAQYFGRILPASEADEYFKRLRQNIDWRHDQAIIMGKLVETKRKVAWYGDRPFSYTYSNTTKEALTWTKELMELKKLVEEITGVKFNSCLMNLYHNGDEGVSWHSDGEKALEHHGAIASLSLGAERKFSFKHKETKETVSIVLEHGSLLIMKGETQSHWMHCLPKTKKVRDARINLTFRKIVES